MSRKPAASTAVESAGDALARMRAMVRRIPRGRVASYGQIAALAGLKGRARMVARALRQDDGRALPWFRVLRSDGRIAFPQGSPGFDEQCRRLARERVAVVKGRVDLARHGWQRDLDALLWGPDGA